MKTQVNCASILHRMRAAPHDKVLPLLAWLLATLHCLANSVSFTFSLGGLKGVMIINFLRSACSIAVPSPVSGQHYLRSWVEG